MIFIRYAYCSLAYPAQTAGQAQLATTLYLSCPPRDWPQESEDGHSSWPRTPRTCSTFRTAPMPCLAWAPGLGSRY